MSPMLKFENRNEAIKAAADSIEAAINNALSKNKRARIAVSGGSTPEPIFKDLAMRNLDWENIDIALVDDRWVNLDNAGSNEAMIRRAFEDAKGVNIIGMKNNNLDAFAAENEINEIYSKLRPFDAILLGMGNDGHTASWFPKAKELEELLSKTPKTIMATDVSHSSVGGAYPQRMTITLPVVAETEMVILALFGEEKLKTFEHCISNNDENECEYPINTARKSNIDNFVIFWAN